MILSIHLPLQLIGTSDTDYLPVYATAQAAGMDLRAHISQSQVLKPGAFVLVPTAVAIALPQGYEGQVRPRSGLAAKFGITVLNSPGTIDSDYRGEIKVILINHGTQDWIIEPKMRIAQLVIASVVQAEIRQEISLQNSERGQAGFGSTGVK